QERTRSTCSTGPMHHLLPAHSMVACAHATHVAPALALDHGHRTRRHGEGSCLPCLGLLTPISGSRNIFFRYVLTAYKTQHVVAGVGPASSAAGSLPYVTWL